MSSFANGAKQIAYTAVFGGGISATVAIQDLTDTTAGGVTNANFIDPVTGLLVASPVNGLGTFACRSLPQLNGRIDLDQGWGSASIMGAIGQVNNTTNTGTNAAAFTTAGGVVVPAGAADFNADKTVWAVGAGDKINLPMIAAGDVLWLNAAYAKGMTEYTVNWLYFKSSDTRRNTGGFVQDAPSSPT